MVQINDDASGVEETNSEYSVITPGWYDCLITDVQLKQSKAGNEMLQIEFTLLDGHFKNRKVWDYFLLSENTKWKRNPLYMATVGKETIDDTDELLDKQCVIKVGNEPYNGKLRAKYLDVKPAGQGISRVASNDTSSSLDTDDIPF